MSGDWREQGVCAQVDPQLWFPVKGESGRPAKRVCATCPVIEECLDYAVVTYQEYGVWGGKSREELRKIRRERGLVHPLTPSYLKQRKGAA